MQKTRIKKKIKWKKTKIEWVRNSDGTQGYTLNPIKGKCKIGCPYCYARRMYDRFKWDPEVRFIPEELDKISTLKKPSTIFLCSTHEIAGNWIPDDWIKFILGFIGNYPQHTFQLLTKNPGRIKYFYFPSNLWLGVTVTRVCDWYRVSALESCNAKIKFISFEPLLENVITTALSFLDIDWIIIGSRTQPYRPPRRKWVEEIIEKADKHKIPIFIKNNLIPLLGENYVKNKQNFPK